MMMHSTKGAGTKLERVFITGASGCVGHYLINECLKIPHLHIHVLVRRPERLKFSKEAFERMTIHQGDFRNVEMFESVIKTMTYVIHTLTEWWGDEQTQVVNVDKTKQLFMMTDGAVCKQIIYFSTASLLGKGTQVIPEAHAYGSSYIKSKYNAYHMIQSLPIADRITTVFPTVVFGGDKTYPQSHITKGISESFRYLNFIRYIYVDGAFQFMHSADIAKVAVYLMQNPTEKREYALGNAGISFKDALFVLATLYNKKPLFRIHVSKGFVFFLAKVLRIKIGPWERFCIENPNMVFDAVSPKDFGLKGSFESLESLVKDIQSF